MQPKNNSCFWHALASTAVLLLSSAAIAVPAADGLYASVETTSGAFTIDLDFARTPKTVANFVGLAEGTRAWVDSENGEISNEPFYDGLKIPRAEPGFVIQFGSPTNTLSGGPGYQFGDEFHPDVGHHGAGFVSMANSGADTNGSQLFVTLAATNFLDKKHSVFGRVVEGLNVVQAIGGQPASSVTINKVTIVRVGAAAEGFDPTAWGLPVVRDTEEQLDVSAAPASYVLNYLPRPFTQFTAFNSSVLTNWQSTDVQFLSSAPPADFDVTPQSAGNDQQFFNLVEVEYSPVPETLNGLTFDLTLTSSDPDQSLTMTFTADERVANDPANPLGSYTLNPDPITGVISAYTWNQDLHHGQIGVILDGIGTFFFNCDFAPDGSGTFTGYASGGNSAGPFPFFGPFTSGTSVP
jgi:cyclophilin family peptidyl-prolyl cis-trans isomerase